MRAPFMRIICHLNEADIHRERSSLASSAPCISIDSGLGPSVACTKGQREEVSGVQTCDSPERTNPTHVSSNNVEMTEILTTRCAIFHAALGLTGHCSIPMFAPLVKFAARSSCLACLPHAWSLGTRLFETYQDQ
jgi:hypothetical protein